MIADDLHEDASAYRSHGLLDRRLTVLETRFDTTLTMLPNKADLSELKAELKADIHGESARLSKWAAATAITMVFGFGGMILTMLSRLPHAHQGQIFGSDVIIENAETKSGLYDTTGALAVDMESQVAARFAAKRNLPLAALRVISDDASHVLPPAALVAMKPDGGIALGRVLWSLLKKPAQIPALVHTARNSNKAFAELLRCRDLCGVGFAGTDL